MNVLAIIGLLRSPLGKLGVLLFAVLAFGLWVDINATQRTLAKVEAERVKFEAEIAVIKSNAEALGAEQEQTLTILEKELADALAAIEAAGAAGDDGSGGISGVAGMRLNSIR